MPFITAFNPNNPNIYSTVKSSVNCLKNNSVNAFRLSLVQSKRQLPNLKKLLTEAEYGEVLSGPFNCSDKRCECCNYLLINDHYTFKNVQITFKLKNRFTCDSFNLIYIVICDKCKEEYIGETEEGKTKIRDRVRLYRQHIRQPQYQQLKIKEHLRVCGNGDFQIFPLLQMRAQDTNLIRSYETSFQQKFKTKLNHNEKLTLEKFTRNLPL